jgi:hypothetical protein
MDRQKFLSGVAWLWVVGAFAAYMVQYRDFVRPVLGALGIL